MFVSIFNRVVVLIAALVILAGAVITTLVAVGISAPDVVPYGWFQTQLQRVAAATGAGVVGIIAVSIVIALGMIAVLLLESMPLRGPSPLLISSTEVGVTTIDVDSVRTLVENAGATIHGVHDVDSTVKKCVEGLLISCRALVALGINVPEVGAELQSKIKEIVEKLTGLPVVRVDIKIRYRSKEARRLTVH